MKAMRSKARESIGDKKDEKVPKRTQKPKKLTELGKLASTTQQRGLSEFVDQMANTFKEFEKMDPSLKNMIRDIFTEKTEVSNSSKSLSQKNSKQSVKGNPVIKPKQPTAKPTQTFLSGVKPSKFTIESIEEVETHKEDSVIKQPFHRETTQAEYKLALSKSGQKLQQQYKYVIGYHGKWNTVKAFMLLKKDTVYLIKGSNLIAVQNKINLFITDGSHKGSLVILYCIMHSIPIIKIDWITESIKKGDILDPTDFKFDLNLDHKIFDRLNITIYRDSLKNKQGVHNNEAEITLLEDAVKRFGGVLKTNATEADYLVVIDAFFDRFTNSKTRKDSSLQSLVNYKWVVDCILENFKKNPINPVYDLKCCN